MAALLFVVAGAGAGGSPAGTKFNFGEDSWNNCVLTAKNCANFPQFNGRQFADKFGAAYLDLSNPSACLRRAEDFHHWCGNGRSEWADRKQEDNKNSTNPDTLDGSFNGLDASVAATFLPTGDSQIYFPDACPKNWSLYRDSCYIHVWRAKTWWEAEDWCQKASKDSHLCSIHGKAENEFVFTLTKGLSSWIGYHDTGREEEKKWSDDSKTDFENMNKNCTGRETEPDCQPKEVAQQWFDWNGADRGTWVCKMPAKYALRLLRNETTLEMLPRLEWGKFKLPLQPGEISPLRLGKSTTQQEEEEEVLTPKKKSRVDLGKVPKAKAASVCDDCD